MSKSTAFTVAIDGDDANPGTSEQPFATLHRARDAAREVDEPVTVRVHGGTHYLAEPLVLGPEDSRSADAPLRFEAAAGEAPVVSGALKLDLAWEPYRDGILRAEVPAVLPTFTFDQLFVNGCRRHCARYPSYDPDNPTQNGKGFVATGEQHGGDPSTELEFFRHEAGFNPSGEWARPEEAIIHVRWFYGTIIHQLRGMDYEQNRFLLGRGGWHWNTRLFSGANYMHYSKCYVENVFEELNTPGEWYFDKQDSTLYYMPEKGEDMATATVEVPQLRQLVVMQGDQDNPVQHVAFSGFRFTHTTTVFMEPWEAPSMGDWTIHRSGALFMEGAEDCSVENSVFHATGGNAVFMNGYTLRNTVSGCSFTETGESAVCLVGYHMNRLGTARPFPDECVIHNNHMHHLGSYQTQVAGVFLACCQKTIVSHNDIHDVPRAAVLMHDPTWGGHVIEYNRLYRTCLDSTDHGPFNSWGRTRHWCHNQSHGPDFPSHEAGKVEEDALYLTELRYNYLEELNGNFGVDQDDGTCRMRIHHNVLVGCPVKFRETTDSVAENNIIIDSSLGTRIDTAYEHNTNKFVRNIVVCRKDMHIGKGYGIEKADFRRHFYHAMMCPIEGPLFEEVDHNLFWSDLGEFKACVSGTDAGKRKGKPGESEIYSLEAWQAQGYDKHSVFADPMFEDEAGGDYRLKPESPALKLGFESFGMQGWGLTSDFPGPRPADDEASKDVSAATFPGANP